ncbi:MAG: vanadium-dependent haloperoxidase [Chitinophagaceae bacterium]
MKQKIIPVLVISLLLLFSCKKETENEKNLPVTEDETTEEQNRSGHHGHLKETNDFSSEVAVKWLNLQLRIIKVPPGVAGASPQRLFAYCGIALYESVVEGMPHYQSIARQLNQLPALPKTERGKAYHWATCANSALASMNRNLLSAAPDASQMSMDSLENALSTAFKTQTSPSTFQRSVEYGKAIAQVIFDWSKTDGTFNVNPPYVPPGTLPGAAPGLWIPFPSTAIPVNPYTGNLRLLVKGSNWGTEPSPPPAYSADPSSAYYAMVKDVYDVSQNLTPEQTALALYYRDSPGYPGGGHYTSMLTQVLEKANKSLDVAALAYVRTGIALLDALIACWKTKYTVNLERPVQSVRGILGYATWLPLFNAPAHPEFPSAHSNQAAAFEVAMASVFGNRFEFTNHTYDFLGLPPRSYHSFSQLTQEIGISRLYAGIHYRASIEKGKQQGDRVARNILWKLRFRKWH